MENLILLTFLCSFPKGGYRGFIDALGFSGQVRPYHTMGRSIRFQEGGTFAD